MQCSKQYVSRRYRKRDLCRLQHRQSVPPKVTRERETTMGDSGLGAGSDPEVGREAAQSSIDLIHQLLDDGTKMVFITAGMGGGTGTGAAPIIAGEAKRMGILTIGIVTIPFYFEKKKKIIKALQGVEAMRKKR